VVPIHYDTFPPITQDAKAWADRVRAATRTEPVVLQPGDWLDLGGKG
jgi:L-ascorbate metabolism protein UlaG (beta-lactamase superfamily)